MASIVSAGTTSATALNMSADTSGVLQLASNNGTVALTVNTSQNVGIGTSSPDSKLAVYNATGTSQFRFGASSSYYWDISRDNDVTGNLLFSNNNATSRTTRMVIDSSGNVGIGTSSPTAKLEVYDATTAVARVTAGTEIFEIRNTGSEVRLAVVSADPMTFRTSNVEAMRIESSGNLLQTGVTTASGALVSGFGSASSNTTVNSSTYNITMNTSAKVFWVSLGNGDACLVVTNYLTTTITIIGTVTSIAATASPSASQLGISKSANSHVVTFKTGSAAATQYGSWAVGVLSSSVS